MSEHLVEYAAVGNDFMRIDRTAAKLRGVKILGLRSTNGREYSPTALVNAIALYDGAKVNVNHPKGSTIAVRDYQDRIGHLSDVRFEEEQGLFGDLCYNPKHPLAEQLLWDAEHAPQRVGLSHNVLARTAQRDNATIVEEIVKVFSVDLVADPATTSSLFEGEVIEADIAQKPPALPGGNSSVNDEHAICDELVITPRQSRRLQAVLPNDSTDTTTQHNTGDRTEPTLEQQLQKQREDFERLQEELNEVRQQLHIAEQSARAKELLAEFGLPDPTTILQNAGDKEAGGVVDMIFWKQLIECQDQKEMRQIVGNRARLIEQAQQWHRSNAKQRASAFGHGTFPRINLPSSREQNWNGNGEVIESAKDFASAIKTGGITN